LAATPRAYREFILQGVMRWSKCRWEKGAGQVKAVPVCTTKIVFLTQIATQSVMIRVELDDETHQVF
jgi:hypothetical protein